MKTIYDISMTAKETSLAKLYMKTVRRYLLLRNSLYISTYMVISYLSCLSKQGLSVL